MQYISRQLFILSTLAFPCLPFSFFAVAKKKIPSVSDKLQARRKCYPINIIFRLWLVTSFEMKVYIVMSLSPWWVECLKSIFYQSCYQVVSKNLLFASFQLLKTSDKMLAWAYGFHYIFLTKILVVVEAKVGWLIRAGLLTGLLESGLFAL